MIKPGCYRLVCLTVRAFIEILGIFAEIICVKHMPARCGRDFTRSRYVTGCTLAVRSGISGFYIFELQERSRKRPRIELTAVITKGYEF